MKLGIELSRYCFIASILVTLMLIFTGKTSAGDIDAKLPDSTSSFQVKDSANNVLMKVQSGGNVGIGTTSPAYKLHLVDGELMIHNGTYDLSFSAGAPGVISTWYGMDIKSMATSRLRIQSDGNVGIGTTDPKEKVQIGDRLTIHDGGWKVISYNSYYDGNNDIRMASGFSSAMAFSDSGDIRFRTAGTGSAGDILDMGAYSTWESDTPPLIVKNDGNVGIGTASPISKLEISDENKKVIYFSSGYGDSQNDSSPMFIGRKARGTASEPSAVQSEDLLSYFGAKGYDGTSWDFLSTGGVSVVASENHTGASKGTYIKFLTTPNGSATKSTRMVIDNYGNVGIGTGNPSAPLSIQSSVTWPFLPIMTENNVDTVSGAGILMKKSRGTTGSKAPVTSGDVMGAVHFAGYDGSDYKVAASIQGAAVGAISSGSVPGIITFRASDGTYDEYGLGKERMRINSSGNVGIGTTNQFGGGAGILSLGDAATPPTSVLTDAAALYASGGHLYAYDADGTATQISPHDPETGEWIFYSKNTKTGRVVRVNMEKLVKKIEELTGERFMEEWIDEVAN